MNTSTTRNPWLRFALLSSLCSLCLCGSSLGADAKEAYRLRVVLHVARHRLLTPVFREQVARELGDGLRAALGDLARVDVVDKHPRLEDVLARGLGRALDSWEERSGVKTHFVLVDFAGGYYSIRARQHDGLTGLSGPVVRRDRTRDRAFVAKVAALLVEKDLGLLGTVTSEPDGQGRVRVELKGGGLGVPLGRWVKKGSIFALVDVPPGRHGQKVDWALLRVEEPPKEDEGACTATLFRRYRMARVTGLTCVQLGTVRAPLRLRLRQERPDRSGLADLSGLVTLEIRRHGFDGKEAGMLTESTAGPDVDTSRRGDRGVFDGVAFVTVKSEDQPRARARAPVAIVSDRLVVLPVPPTSEEEDLVRVRLAALQRSVDDAYEVQVSLFKEINELTAKPEQRARAIAEVRQALERSRADRGRLARERNDLAGDLEKVKDRPSLAGVDDRLKQLKSGEADLQRHVAELERIEKDENDPRTKKWLAEIVRAKALEEQAEVEDALKIYEQVRKEGYKDPERKLAKHVAYLKKLWAPQSDEHKVARDFIYREWPKLDNAGLKANLSKANEMFKVCRGAHDIFGPRKLLRATETHAVRMAKERAALRPDINIDDQKPAELIKEITPKLKELADALRVYLEKEKPPPPE